MFVEERTPSCFMCTFFKEFPQFLFYFCIQGNLSGKESFHKNQSMPPTWPPLLFSFKCRITLVFKCQLSVTIALVFNTYYEYFLSYRPLKYIFYFTLLISVCYKSSGDEKKQISVRLSRPPVITRLNVAYETTLVLLCSVKWVKHVSLCKPENIHSLKVELCMTSVNILKLLYIHNVLTLREPGGNFLRFC